MTRKQWVLEKLKENDLVISELLNENNYIDYCEETESNASYSSFKRYVYQVFNDYDEEGLEENLVTEEDDYPLYEDKDFLINLLEEETLKRQGKLRYSDLVDIAKKNDFSVKSFYNIPSVKDILSDIYKANSLDFHSDVNAEKLQRKIKTLQSEIDGLKSKHVDHSTIVDALNSVVKEYIPVKVPSLSFKSKKNTRAIVGLLSDVHSGELVSLEETMGLNEYNRYIMLERLDTYFQKLIEYGQEMKADILYLQMLGDMISGTIHEELIANSDLDTTESMIIFADYVAQWIQKLSKYFVEIHISALSGNHGRFSKKPPFKKKNTLNFDYIAYEFIRRETAKIVKSFDLPKSAYLVKDIMGEPILFIHGDMVKGGTGLQPTSGTWIRDFTKLNSVFEKVGKKFKYVNMGHFHTSILDFPSFDGTSIIVNGSVKGADEFSLGAVKKGEPPTQVVYTVEKGEGVKYLTKINL